MEKQREKRKKEKLKFNTQYTIVFTCANCACIVYTVQRRTPCHFLLSRHIFIEQKIEWSEPKMNEKTAKRIRCVPEFNPTNAMEDAQHTYKCLCWMRTNNRSFIFHIIFLFLFSSSTQSLPKYKCIHEFTVERLLFWLTTKRKLLTCIYTNAWYKNVT